MGVSTQCRASRRPEEATRRRCERPTRRTFHRQSVQKVADDLRQVRVVIRAVLLASRDRALIQKQGFGDLGHGTSRCEF
jgi:hypothetical protein